MPQRVYMNRRPGEERIHIEITRAEISEMLDKPRSPSALRFWDLLTEAENQLDGTTPPPDARTDRPAQTSWLTTPGLAALARELDAERARQLAKFGDQRHPDLVGGPDRQQTARELFARWARNYRAINDGALDPRDPDDGLDWTGILLEEVYEALAEADPAKLRAELVQVAAVCAAWISDIDRRQTVSPAAAAAGTIIGAVQAAASKTQDDFCLIPSGDSPVPHRRLTEAEHAAAWHAVEGAAGEDGADPGTVLAAVLRALDIDGPAR